MGDTGTIDKVTEILNRQFLSTNPSAQLPSEDIFAALVAPRATLQNIGDNPEASLLTGATFNFIESSSSKGGRRKRSQPMDDFEEEIVYAKIPIPLEKYHQPHTTESYELKERSGREEVERRVPASTLDEFDDLFSEDDGVVDQLGWENSNQSVFAPSEEEDDDTTHKRGSKRAHEEPSISLREKQSLKRRREGILERSGYHHVPVEEVMERNANARNNDNGNRPLTKDDMEKEFVNLFSNIRELINKCIENKQWGREVLQKVQRESNDLSMELANTMGSSNDCFLCLFGNREFDKTTDDKVNGMYRILTSLLFKDVTLKAIAIEMHAYYVSEIYEPGLKSGSSLPYWSAEGIEKHIRKHINDPRVKLFLRIEKVELAMDVLQTQITYYDEEDGNTKVNYVALRLLHSYIKLDDDLSKKCIKDMVGYDETLSLKPSNMWLENRVVVTNKKTL